MSSPLSTEGRIFAAQYFREARRIEALHAGRISAGATTWTAALDALFDRMDKAGSPIRRAALIKAAIEALERLDPQEAMHINFGSHAGRRAAMLMLGTFRAGQHPLEKVTEEGLSVLRHGIRCRRRGSADLVADTQLAYISRHAIGRLRERSPTITPRGAFCLFAGIGVLGHLTRHCDQHVEGELCLRWGDILAVGSLKHAVAGSTFDDRLADGTFYDVRSMLPAAEVRDEAKLAQGDAAHAAVMAWLETRRDADQELARAIPFRPRREDFTLRSVAGL